MTRFMIRSIFPAFPVTFLVMVFVLSLVYLLRGALGPGVPESAAGWGSMLSSGPTYLQGADHWWLIYLLGIAIILTCVAFNFVGFASRHAFEIGCSARRNWGDIWLR